MKKFNPKDFSLEAEIIKRVNLEDQLTPYTTYELPKYVEPKKKKWSITAIKAFVLDLRP